MVRRWDGLSVDGETVDVVVRLVIDNCAHLWAYRKRNLAMKQIARFILWLNGWKIDQNFPKESQRSVMIAAPHTSNWDFYYLRLAFWVLGIPMKVAIKNDWTKPPIGWLLHSLGALGIDRGPKGATNRKSQVEAMVELFTSNAKIALVIAPEGTRKQVQAWKKGFYWIAQGAQVPITCGYLDYKNKIAGVGSLVVQTTGDLTKDLIPIMEFYKDIQGKHPYQFQIDEKFIDVVNGTS